jgi:hypothetical protein
MRRGDNRTDPRGERVASCAERGGSAEPPRFALREVGRVSWLTLIMCIFSQFMR